MSEARQKEQFQKLVRRGTNYVSRPSSRSVRGVKSWQNACVRWLKENLPDAGLAEDVLVVPQPSDESYQRRISAADLRNIQRTLKAFLRARDLLPFLVDEKQQQKPLPENARKVFIVHGHNDALKTSVARLLEEREERGRKGRP